MMQKTLTYSGLIIASLIVIALFITATTYTQLGVAVVLYPLIAYLLLKVIPRKSMDAPVISINLPYKKAAHVEADTETETGSPEKQKVDVSDIDKRAFLKLIGGAGLSFFLFSLLNRKAEGLFFGRSSSPETVSLKDVEDRRIDPAQRQPTDGYRITEIDDNIVTYYGFTNKDGAWFIMQENTEIGSFRYSKGDFNFSQGWQGRKNLSYGYFNDIF